MTFFVGFTAPRKCFLIQSGPKRCIHFW